MNETLLKSSCSKTCGENQCDFDSYCGEDNRCLYCADALCHSPPPGCELSCGKRHKDDEQIYFNLKGGKNQTVNSSMNECKTSNRIWPLVSIAMNVILLSAIIFIQRQWIVENVPKMISKIWHWKCESDEKKTLKPIVVNNTSNVEEQTTALLVTGKDYPHLEHNIC
ncbi:uncharacterized protein LOC133199622 [Saccostrea echinata]|uniref:uncharacterized protein LOC133199622 n=1 Tax=Saccostrea echinata TaxID=191078 RepID=UPI002A8241E7|nr:uncharacterized protein LOC133199622 [Saccostrea echinata]